MAQIAHGFEQEPIQHSFARWFTEHFFASARQRGRGHGKRLGIICNPQMVAIAGINQRLKGADKLHPPVDGANGGCRGTQDFPCHAEARRKQRHDDIRHGFVFGGHPRGHIGEKPMEPRCSLWRCSERQDRALGQALDQRLAEPGQHRFPQKIRRDGKNPTLGASCKGKSVDAACGHADQRRRHDILRLAIQCRTHRPPANHQQLKNPRMAMRCNDPVIERRARRNILNMQEFRRHTGHFLAKKGVAGDIGGVGRHRGFLREMIEKCNSLSLRALPTRGLWI